MCGIVGALSFNNSEFKISHEYIEKMNLTQSHRGPDGSGTWISKDENVGFGHRRLSIIDLSENEAREFLSEMGVNESGAGQLIQKSYSLLGLQTYFTTGEKETRAWTIRKGDTAPKAAGVIHGDFERGFIKAETVAYNDLIECGSIATARDRGLYRMEGKEYVVQEGDVMLFKFNV